MGSDMEMTILILVMTYKGEMEERKANDNINNPSTTTLYHTLIYNHLIWLIVSDGEKIVICVKVKNGVVIIIVLK